MVSEGANIVHINHNMVSFLDRGFVLLKEYVNTSEQSKQDLKHNALGR